MLCAISQPCFFLRYHMTREVCIALIISSNLILSCAIFMSAQASNQGLSLLTHLASTNEVMEIQALSWFSVPGTPSGWTEQQEVVELFLVDLPGWIRQLYPSLSGGAVGRHRVGSVDLQQISRWHPLYPGGTKGLGRCKGPEWQGRLPEGEIQPGSCDRHVIGRVDSVE